MILRDITLTCCRTRVLEDKVDLWLVSGAERFRRDPELRAALLQVARNDRSRQCLLLLASILDTPHLVERLTEILRPAEVERKPAKAVPKKAARGRKE